MNWIYRNWQKLGLGFAVVLAIGLLLFHQDIDSFRIVLIISLITLFLHQFEEYQLPGHFKEMVNRVMFGSKKPEHYPLNPRTAFIINVIIGWGSYTLAIIFGASAIWLATATVMISLGNVFAHSLMFNIRGKTLYNPGMASSLIIFLPFVIYFVYYCASNDLFTTANLIVGIILGLIMNYFGVIKLITLLADKREVSERV